MATRRDIPVIVGLAALVVILGGSCWQEALGIPPDCPSCTFWNGSACVPVGDCLNDYYCTGCQSCQDCWCQDDDWYCLTWPCHVCLNGDCYYKCKADECCELGECIKRCTPNAGTPCTYTLPPVYDPVCAPLVPGVDFSCLNPGACCKWKVVSGPIGNAQCAGCDLDCAQEYSCVTLEPVVCRNVLSIVPPFIWCECSGTPDLVYYQYAGTAWDCKRW